MRKRNALVAVGVAVAASLAGVQAQRGSSEESMFTGRDYAEIAQLYSRYGQYYDSCLENGGAFARLFAPDGQFIISGGPIFEGREQLIEFAKCPAGVTRRWTQHWIGDVVITPSAEGATVSAYVMQVHNIQQKIVSSGGRYEDIVVRSPEGWVFKKHTYFPPDRDPNASEWRTHLDERAD